MSKKYPEYKQLDLSQIGKDILEVWEKENTFERSVETREGKENFVFYEGPPSANGQPGIHHVMARTIKDIFCRYKTLKGYQVKRKAGWDTHGLPVELGVEKEMGITKEDIGKTVTVEEYNAACREAVMKYTGVWNDLTRKMGYWVDMEHPYITYENKYIESVWYLLNQLFEKGLLYKGYTIQPYSPAAGTGLSTHELNQPGAYRDVKDRTAVAQFKIADRQDLPFSSDWGQAYFIAWTTTPWTLPSNTALAVGKNIDYVLVKTYNLYTYQPITVVLAKNLLNAHFPEKNAELKLEDYKEGDKNAPFEVVAEFKGSDLAGIRYEQLLPFAQPEDGDAFKVLVGDFVTTEDGTGIVHLAPSFGADDFRTAKQNGVGSLTLVDKRGRFTEDVKDGIFLYGGEYVKEAYLSDEEKEAEFQKQKGILEANGKIKELKEYLSVDERIVLKLQEEGKLFKKESYNHSYPHCWRTDKPVLYYPLDSWFVKTTAAKQRLLELNETINWKPASTGTGRFANWLENLVDWNLSRSRFWGIPIPIWSTEDGEERTCIGSAAELKEAIEKAVEAGVMDNNPLADFDTVDLSKENYEKFDLHRPYVDDIVLVSPSGKKMYREPDLIDVWFDSGSMPYAQSHYPFENKEELKANYPADFIAEGVDQTRGWFFTLHAIAVMLFDSVAYKNVVSNGLVLDKNGNKMSKRLGNAVDPFETIEKYGPDATRWYMITNAQPWDNLRFDEEGIDEIRRKFFGTLYNTYSFFALYANIDGFTYEEEEVPINERPELDRWILSMLNSLIKEVDEAYNDYEPTKAGRAVQHFLDEHLSNWYVRLSRRRFWKGTYTQDKISAYQTLYRCLEVVAQLSSPIAPFFAERLFSDLNATTGRVGVDSVHLSDFPEYKAEMVDKDLEERMLLAQKVSSLVLSLRQAQKIRVRQPLNKILVPVLDDTFKRRLESVTDLILSEVNVKELEFLTETTGVLVKKIKPDFKKLGPKYGKHMKAISAAVGQFGQEEITQIEKDGFYELDANGEAIRIELEDVEISSEDIPGWLVANEGNVTVALDITVTTELREEGIAREFVSRIQNLRKERDYEVTDRIELKIQKHDGIESAIVNNKNYICSETLAETLEIVDSIENGGGVEVEIDTNISTYILIDRINKN